MATHEFDKQFLWTPEQIKQTETLFDDVFELFMEERFLSVVYSTNKASLNQSEFIKKFQASKKSEKELKDGLATKAVFWLFSPSRVSSVFSQLCKDQQREECFLIEKVDWADERNELLSLDSWENADSSKGDAGMIFS